jgi:hypothetical protein
MVYTGDDHVFILGNGMFRININGYSGTGDKNQPWNINQISGFYQSQPRYERHIYWHQPGLWQSVRL